MSNRIDHGKVALTFTGESWDAGVVYDRLTVVDDPDSLSKYMSLRPDNVGHALSDEEWWMKWFDGGRLEQAISETLQTKEATEGAKAATEAATRAALATCARFEELLTDAVLYVPVVGSVQTLPVGEPARIDVTNDDETKTSTLDFYLEAADMSGKEAEIDGKLAQMRAEINEKQLEVGAVPVDEVPTAGSAGRVTSGGLYATLKDSTKGFVDEVPTAGSDNLVKSGGVARELAAVSQNVQATKYSIDGNNIKVAYAFNDKYIVVLLRPQGGNNLFEFASFRELGKSDDIDELGTIILSNNTDWHQPFIVAAVNNIDGDDVESHYFTGGNHQYNNTGSGSTPTARCTGIKFYVDGEEKSAGKGTCRQVKMEWTNYVQAYNTKKVDGSGREVLKEEHVLVFEAGVFTSTCTITALEDIVVETYYGMAFSAHATVFPNIVYSDNGKAVYTGASNSGKKDTKAIVGYGDMYKILMQMDDGYGIGDFRLYDGDRSAFASTSKAYFTIVSNQPIAGDTAISFRGTWEVMASTKKTMYEVLNYKLDKEEGKVLIDAEIADTVSIADDSKWLARTLDNEGKLVKGTKTNEEVVNLPLNIKDVVHDSVDSDRYAELVLDKDGKILYSLEKKAQADGYSEGIKEYKRLLEAVDDDNHAPFLLGSQLVQANVSTFDKELGEHDTFNPEKLSKQFNYIGLSGNLPERRDGWLQRIEIDGVQATILYMGVYIYAMTTGNTVYRIPYSKLSAVTNSNTEMDAIEVDCGNNMELESVFETNDGNFIVQCVNTDSGSDDHNTRFLYKAVLDSSLHAAIHFLFKCVESTSNAVAVREHWSFKQYGEKILMTPYGSGRTGQAWWSEDFGNTFECIFNVANDDTYVSTKPDGEGGYGAYGIHPVPRQMIPAQGDGFWEGVSSIGNGSKHVHSCCYDEEFNRIWLVMGDDKYLATGIYWSDDFGKTWHRKSLVFNSPTIDKGGTTQMLQVVSLKNCVLFGTDGWGNGIFRYNRGKKDEDIEIELAFKWSDNPNNLEGVANHTIVTRDGIVLMTFAPDTVLASPVGGIVASDGYHFKRVYVDHFADGSTLSSQKIGWTSFLSVHGDDLYIRTKAKNEIIVIERFSV